MRRIDIIFAVLLACAYAEDARESRVVATAQGPVRGYKSEGIFNFYGIPYATAPTGKLRFTAPLPGPIWMQPLEAVNNDIVCPQVIIPALNVVEKLRMQENCLIANVYMPDTEETNLPVVVYVHGGAYQAGFGELASPTTLVQSKKVVAVTFNYRLGAQGFLCLGTKGAPGNAGMKDQVALLRWVNKNIANFGGNPNDVAIAGYSAGSSAVDLLMLSKMTKGLYNKVIPESGASVAGWSIQPDPLQNAKSYAKQLNFTNVDDIDALEEFYTTAPYEVLTSDILVDRPDNNFIFLPCVERGDTGVETFLEDTPVNILTQGEYRKVPVLYGFANMEGLFRADMFKLWKDKMNERFSDFLPLDLKFSSDEEKEQVVQIIKKFYFGDKPVSEETVQNYIDYFSDVTFTYPHLRSLKLQVKAGSDSIYLYEYSYYRELNIPLPSYLSNLRGASHCAQSLTVLDTKYLDVGVMSEEFLQVKKVLTEIWLNFITTGKPVPEGSTLPSWPPAGADWSPHMELGKELKLKGPLLAERARFWEGIYEKYYRVPVAPSGPAVRTEL